jgi:hypothetical protein
LNEYWKESNLSECQKYKTPTSVLTGPNDEFVAIGYEAEIKYNKYLAEGAEGYNLYQNFNKLLHKIWSVRAFVTSKNR